MADRERAAKVLAAVLGEQSPTRTAHRFRADVIELGTRLEHALDEVLSDSVARSASAGRLLRTDVVWRAPFAVRVDLLRDLLEREQLAEVFGHIPVVLTRFMDLRNLLAHGLVHRVPEGADELVVTSARRGVVKAKRLRFDYVVSLVALAELLPAQLAQVWAGVVPASRHWHDR